MKTALRILLAILALSALLTAAAAPYPASIAQGKFSPDTDPTIGNLTEIVTVVANRHFNGDVVTACHALYFLFESDAQFHYVMSVLTGS